MRPNQKNNIDAELPEYSGNSEPFATGLSANEDKVVNRFEVLKAGIDSAFSELTNLLQEEKKDGMAVQNWEPCKKKITDLVNRTYPPEKSDKDKRQKCFKNIDKISSIQTTAGNLMMEKSLSDAEFETVRNGPFECFSVEKLNRCLYRDSHTKLTDILTKMPELVEECKEYKDDYDGSSILMIAVAQGEANEAYELIRILDVKSPEIDSQDTGYYQNTALILLAAKGWVGKNGSGKDIEHPYHKIAAELINRGANPNIQNGPKDAAEDLKYTALDLAVARRDVEMVKAILNSTKLEKETVERSVQYLSKLEKETELEKCSSILENVLCCGEDLSSMASVPQIFSENVDEIKELLQSKIALFEENQGISNEVKTKSVDKEESIGYSMKAFGITTVAIELPVTKVVPNTGESLKNNNLAKSNSISGASK